MNPIQASHGDMWPEQLPWEGLVALVIKMTGAKKLTLTEAGIEFARTHRLTVSRDGLAYVFEIAQTVPDTPRQAA